MTNNSILIEQLKNAIEKHLDSQFERDLLGAAFANLNDTSNKLRLNNFAYSMRELTRHFLERLASDSDVLSAPWFVPYNSSKPKEITRAQRIKYAIQGWLSDDYIKDTLNIDFEEASLNLRNSINELSKYTHINPETFYVDNDTISDTSITVLEDTLQFFDTVCKSKNCVDDAIEDCINEELISSFYTETQPDLDILATHYEVLAYFVTDYKETYRNSETIFIDVKGIVEVRLQYGSDGDLRNDIGYEMRTKFPFTSQLTVSYKNRRGDVHIEDATMEINNEEFYN